MAKARRRSKLQRIGDRLERELKGQDAHLVDHIQSLLAEHERRRFWLRLGCPQGPVSQ